MTIVTANILEKQWFLQREGSQTAQLNRKKQHSESKLLLEARKSLGKKKSFAIPQRSHFKVESGKFHCMIKNKVAKSG
jgi:hypothetical protein